MNTIYIVALEPLETRYTGQWFTGIPKILNEHITQLELNNRFQVEQIAGTIVDNAKTTNGAFLNFAATNIWKSEQAIKIAELFSNGKIKSGDKFLFTDFWNPTILQVKYMSELLDIPVELHGIFHAGSYDPQDFLGRKIKDKRWTFSAERSFFFALDYCYFATNFHKELFLNTLFRTHVPVDGLFLQPEDSKFIISGQPHNELIEKLMPYRGMKKRDLVLFPHRVAPEKQPEIFKDLAEHMPDVEFVICQDRNLLKHEYHTLLGEAKVVFSANLQETLGISTGIEALLVDAIPMVPNRLSYSEMFFEAFKYPSEWTESWEKYVKNRENVINWLKTLLTDPLSSVALPMQRAKMLENYANAQPMIDKLLS
jgi:hypothetical protein